MDKVIKTRVIVENLTDDEFATTFFDREYITSLLFNTLQSRHIDRESGDKLIESEMNTLNERISSLEPADDVISRGTGELSFSFCRKSLADLPQVIIGAVASFLYLSGVVRMERVCRSFFTMIRETAPLRCMNKDESWRMMQRISDGFAVSNRFRNLRVLHVDIKCLDSVRPRKIYLSDMPLDNLTDLVISSRSDQFEFYISDMPSDFTGRLNNVVHLTWDLPFFPVHHLFPFLPSLRNLTCWSNGLRESRSLTSSNKLPVSVSGLRLLDDWGIAPDFSDKSDHFLSQIQSLHAGGFSPYRTLRAQHLSNLKELCFDPAHVSFAADLLEKRAWSNLQYVNINVLSKLRRATKEMLSSLIASPNLKRISIGLGLDVSAREDDSWNVSNIDELWPVFEVCRDAVGDREGSSIILHLRRLWMPMDGFDWMGNDGKRLRKEIYEMVREFEKAKVQFMIGWTIDVENSDSRLAHWDEYCHSLTEPIQKELNLNVKEEKWKLDRMTRHVYTISNGCSNHCSIHEAISEGRLMKCRRCVC